MHALSPMTIERPDAARPIALPFSDIPPEHAPTPERPIRVRSRSVPAGERIAWHHHAWAQLAYAPRGVLRMAAEGRTWIVPPSRAVWIPPHVPHEVVAVEAAYLRALYVDESVVPTELDHCRVVEVSGLLREAIAAIDAGRPTPARERLLGELALDELRQSAPLPLCVPLPRDARLRPLCDALLADPANADSLELWASRTGVSTRTISRLFRSELGMSFSQWRQQVGLARAIPLIHQGRALSLVARELGYRSQSAFTAMFRRAFGESPRAFMSRAAREAEDTAAQRDGRAMDARAGTDLGA